MSCAGRKKTRHAVVHDGKKAGSDIRFILVESDSGTQDDNQQDEKYKDECGCLHAAITNACAHEITTSLIVTSSPFLTYVWLRISPVHSHRFP